METQPESLTDALREMVLALVEEADHSLALGDLAAARKDYESASRFATDQGFADLGERAADGLRSVACREELSVAVSARKEGRWSDAENAYQRAGALIAPGDAQAAQEFCQGMLALGQQAAGEGRLPDALRHYAAVLQRLPGHPQALVEQAQVVATLREHRRRKILTVAGALLGSLALLVLGIGIWRIMTGISATAPPREGSAVTQTKTGTPVVASAPPGMAMHSTTLAASSVPTSPPPTTPSGHAKGQTAATTQASANLTATELPISRATKHPASMATPSSASSPPVIVTPTVEYVFRGSIRRTNGEMLGNFESVQLWGTMDLGPGQSNLDAVFAAPDGSFELSTTKAFPYYLLWLQPAEAQIYQPLEAIAGAGGRSVSSQMIRYANPTSGLHGDNVFLVAVMTPTPAPTITRTPTATTSLTSTSTPRSQLPQVSLLSPAADFTTQDQVGFRWEFSAPLPDGIYAEVVMWREGSHPRDALGVAAPVRDTQLSVRFDPLTWISNGPYYWSVILVHMDPYERVTQPTAGWRLFVTGR
jgi:hypothetical protein